MTKTTFFRQFPAILILIGAALVVTPVQALTLAVSPSAPSSDGLDQSNLVASTGTQLIWSDRPLQGQSFTSDSAPSLLNSVTVQMGAGANGVIPGWKDYMIRVGTLGGGGFTEIFRDVARQNANENVPTYFTFTFDDPIQLAPDTLYGFQIGMTGSQAGWQSGIPGVQTSGNTFAGGQRFTGEFPNNAGTAANFSSTSDLVFHLDITVVPEPSKALLLTLGMLGLVLRRRRA